MNRGVLQSSPVQQMVAGSPNWWSSMNNMRPPPSQPPSPFLHPSNLFPPYAPPPPTSSSLLPSLPSSHENLELPESWSHLLLRGLVGEDDHKNGPSHIQEKKLENWEEQLLLHHVPIPNTPSSIEICNVAYQAAAKPTWSQMMPATSSPMTCVSSLSNFSSKNADGRHPPPHLSSECNSTAPGGALKKARVQPSSTQSTFKVRKERLGDRITALHQLVSPFGKTDTASVLLEAIGYIRFLQSQVQALSLPYLGSGSRIRQQQFAQGERNGLFPQDPGQDSQEEPKDLRSRGLCLVPIPCTVEVGSDNGAEHYWAPSLGR
ncbi:hypothetical protein U1Q18_028609 [Sarracenia purpurea var. burkii]